MSDGLEEGEGEKEVLLPPPSLQTTSIFLWKIKTNEGFLKPKSNIFKGKFFEQLIW